MPYLVCGEDDLFVQKLLTELLEKRGLEVRICPTGPATLAAVAERVPDLVLLDLMIPEVPGLEVIRALRSQASTYDTPIVVISGISDEQVMTEALTSGATDYIVKPFSPAELLAKVTLLLRKRQEAAEPRGPLAEGRRIAGRYEVVRRLQSGGFSTVYVARDCHAPQQPLVALKMFEFAPSQRADRQTVAVFLREAYELSRLSHPCIVRFIEFGQDGPWYYLAMEFLQGKPINRLVTESGPLLVRDVVFIGYEVARAIQYLAQHRLVHRDIKPPNIMVTLSGAVKLLDFGLAKLEAEKTLSLTHEFKGTPSFMAPECIDGHQEVTVKADIYSLGATLYYATTSIILFAGKTPLDIIRSHRTLVPPSLREFDPRIDGGFSDLVDRMLAKRCEERPGPDELVAELATLQRRLRQQEQAI